MAEKANSLEFTPTWVVAIVFFFVAFISLCAEHGFRRLGKIQRLNKDWLKFEALGKLKDVFLLLGFLFLQNVISRICIPSHLASHMLPCKKETDSPTNYSSKHCSKGKVPLLSEEALQDLQVFILVLAVVHVIFCINTMVLGRASIRKCKKWEDLARDKSKIEKVTSKDKDSHKQDHLLFISKRAFGYWRKSAVVIWLISFFKQLYNAISKSEYIVLRQGFIMAHCPGHPEFNFHGYMVRAIERDFRKVVSISWYLWLFAVIFLLLNMEGWHTYFWLAFLPLILLLLVGAKLAQIITRLSQDVFQKKIHHQTDEVHPSYEYFWFGRPGVVLDLIHFILFQNSFEIAFFIWIWCTYGFRSCIMGKLGYIIPRLVIAVIVQVLCSNSTLPLYALVSQMSSKFRSDIFEEFLEPSLHVWADETRSKMEESNASRTLMQKMTRESDEHVQVAEEIVVIEAATSSITELPSVAERPLPSP